MPAPSLHQVHRGIERLQELSELFQRRREELAAAVGLTEHQWGVLEEVQTEHFMPSMFAQKRESTQAAVSKTLRQLVDKGLVRRAPGTKDGRHRRYQLTAKGKRVMHELRDQRQQAIDRIWSKLEPSSLEAFIAFAERLSTGLSELSGEARGQ